jgi:hypothetical protein
MKFQRWAVYMRFMKRWVSVLPGIGLAILLSVFFGALA